MSTSSKDKDDMILGKYELMMILFSFELIQYFYS